MTAAADGVVEIEDDTFPIERETWEKQQHLWWVLDPGGDRVRWDRWIFGPAPPRKQLYYADYRHPTYEEACARQAAWASDPNRFRKVVTESDENLNRALGRPERPTSLIFRSGSRETEAVARLAARQRERRRRRWWPIPVGLVDRAAAVARAVPPPNEETT